MFDKYVSEADVVVLGELNHFVHEKADFRQFFSRYLLSRGLRTFAEELGWSDGVRVEQFLHGEEQALSRLPSFGYTGHLREDRDDRPTGVLRASFDAYPTSLFVDEQSRFYRTLRGATKDDRLNYFGFDIDGLPGGTYEDIEEMLSGCRQSPAISNFLSSLTRVHGESLHEEAERLVLARALLENSVGDADARTVALVQASLDALIDSLRYVAETYGARTYEALRPGMALREDAMKRRFENIGTVSGAGSKIAVMGHAFHLVKDDRKLTSGPGGVGPGGGLTCSLGHHLAHVKRKRVFSVWFVYGAGEDSQPFPDLPREAHYPSSSINAVLASFGRPLILPTDDPSLRQPVILGHMYNALVELPLADQADAIFFLPRVTALRSRE